MRSPLLFLRPDCSIATPEPPSENAIAFTKMYKYVRRCKKECTRISIAHLQWNESLSKKNHPLCLGKATGFQSAEVNTGGDPIAAIIAAVPTERVLSRLLLGLINQRTDQSSAHIEDLNLQRRGAGQTVRDGCVGIERVREIPWAGVLERLHFN